MKKLLLLTLFLLFYTSIKSQNLEFFTDFNIGLLSHQPLKKFHNDLVNEIPFNNIETTDSFKYNYGFNVGLKVKSINTSFFFSNRVSGAKSSTSDFSGLVRVTNELKGFSFGGIYEKEIKEFTRGNLYLGFKGMITLSKFNLESETRISSVNLDSFNFNSTDFGIGALITYKYPIGFMFLRAYVGVDIYLGGKLKFEEIEGAHLTFNDGNKVTTGWSGFNTGIGLSIPL
jgi:hypothetical protein